MKKTKPYSEYAAQAEEAVKTIKDPELRRVAFERILEDLLTGSGTHRGSTTPPSSPRRLDTKPKEAKGPKGYIRELCEEGFFKNPRTIAEVKAELANHGHHIPLTSLSGPLQALCKERVLRRQKATSGEEGEKSVYKYSEW